MATSVESRVAGKKLPNLEVLVGTYEEFVLGFKLKENSEGVSIICPLYSNMMDNNNSFYTFTRVLFWCKVSLTTAIVEAFVL